MKVPVKFRIVAHKTGALKQAPAVLRRNLHDGLEAVGKRLQASARARMRKDTGQEQRSLKIEVAGPKLDMTLLVFSSLVQAFVDAYGMRRGIFPPFFVNSKLYIWAKRRLRGLPVKPVRTIGTPQGPRPSIVRRRIPTVRRVRRIRGPVEPINASRRQRARTTNAKRVAFLIARAIYRRGRAGSKWHVKTMEANKTRIVREMKNALSEAANELRRIG